MVKIVLDAGHGYNTSGKRTPDGVREWTMNSNVANKVQSILSNYQNVEITRTDDTTGKTDISLNDRMKKVTSLKPDLFVSIHHNANTSTWGDWTGVEAYAHPQAPAIDKTLARRFVDKLAAKTGLRNRGQKTADFQVLRQCPTATPGILVEGGFMDSRIDHPVIISDKGQQLYAEAIAEVIVDYFKLVKKPTPPKEQAQVNDKGETLFYRVVAGSYTLKSQALEQQEALKAKGISSFLVAEWIKK